MAEPLKALNDLPDGKSIADEAFARANVPITPYEFIWRVAEASREGRDALSYLDIDHEVSPIDSTTGGSVKARVELSKFIEKRLDHYHVDRNHPERHGSSGLSPWLHFGHISSFEIVDAVLKHQKWNPMKITPPHNGRREGWWGANEGAEAFLDQIITWRELGFIYCHQTPNPPNMKHYLSGLNRHLTSIQKTNARTSTPSKNLKTVKHMTHCGMRPKCNFELKASFTII